jgi:2,3-dihydroxybenzoate decarboxylase
VSIHKQGETERPLTDCSIPFNLWRADHWYNKPVKRKNRPSKQDYTYYMTHNVSVTTSGNYSTKALKYCIDVLGEERCMYSIGMSCDLTVWSWRQGTDMNRLPL